MLGLNTARSNFNLLGHGLFAFRLPKFGLAGVYYPNSFNSRKPRYIISAMLTEEINDSFQGDNEEFILRTQDQCNQGTLEKLQDRTNSMMMLEEQPDGGIFEEGDLNAENLEGQVQIAPELGFEFVAVEVQANIIPGEDNDFEIPEPPEPIAAEIEIEPLQDEVENFQGQHLALEGNVQEQGQMWLQTEEIEVFSDSQQDLLDSNSSQEDLDEFIAN